MMNLQRLLCIADDCDEALVLSSAAVVQAQCVLDECINAAFLEGGKSELCRKIHKTQNYMAVLSIQDNDTFKAHFRMSREKFEV